MSFERTSIPGHSPGPSRSGADDAIAPGKQTRVEMLSGVHGGASGPAGADPAHSEPHAAPGHEAGGPHGAEHEDAAQEAAGAEPGELVSEIIMSSGEAGIATGEGASESKPPADHEEHLAHAASDAPETGNAERRPGGHVEITSATAKQAPGGEANNRRTVGVGEVVHLTGSQSGTWSASAGTLSSRHGKRVSWTAPATPAGAAISLNVDGGQSGSHAFSVIAPNSLRMVRFNTDSFKSGTQGAGMHTHVTVGPSSVCFGNVQWLEVAENASNVTGYFTKFKTAELRHHPNPDWLTWNDQNTGLDDHASLSGWPKPWSAGGFQWVIPNKYRVASVGGGGHVFTTTHQVFSMKKDGTTTITKGGASVTRSP